jgi:hypothetical protein
MSSIVIAGDTSGSITLQAPLVAGTNTVTLPATTGYLFVNPTASSVAIANGGTGATTASTALSNLGGTTTGKAIAMTIVFGGG